MGVLPTPSIPALKGLDDCPGKIFPQLQKLWRGTLYALLESRVIGFAESLRQELDMAGMRRIGQLCTPR